MDACIGSARKLPVCRAADEQRIDQLPWHVAEHVLETVLGDKRDGVSSGTNLARPSRELLQRRSSVAEHLAIDHGQHIRRSNEPARVASREQLGARKHAAEQRGVKAELAERSIVGSPAAVEVHALVVVVARLHEHTDSVLVGYA